MTHALTDIINLTNAPTPPRWFEFVFEPDKLEQHLDRSPIELITSFFRNMPELETTSGASTQSVPTITTNNNCNSNGSSTQNGFSDNNLESGELCDVIVPPGSYEAKYRLRKTYALQTLAIKVASHLEWDLDTLCDGLTIPIQCKLMQALKKACEHEKCPPDVKTFSSIIYCRWFLRSAIDYKLSTLQPQSCSTTIIYLSQLQQQQQTADTIALMSMGDLFSDSKLKSCQSELTSYISDQFDKTRKNTLKKLKSNNHLSNTKISRPKISCFNSRDEEMNDWDQCEAIEPLEFLEVACYDLGRSHFFEEDYQQAKQAFEMISDYKDKFPLLESFLQSAIDILKVDRHLDEDESNVDVQMSDSNDDIRSDDDGHNLMSENIQRRKQTEKYLFDCMIEFSKNRSDNANGDDNVELMKHPDEDTDLRIEMHIPNHQRLPENSAWYLQVPVDQQQQQLLEMGKGDLFMSRGNFKQAMGCFVSCLMLATDYFRVFSKNYVDEEPYITRMIQCSISLSCFTQAVALCQMTKSLNYTIAFKQLNERVCYDCCDDIYECIWNVTLLEYIINLHAKRGEVERRTKVIQLIGQLELNENNPEEILREAEHVRRGRFFRILSNKYL